MGMVDVYRTADFFLRFAVRARFSAGIGMVDV